MRFKQLEMPNSICINICKSLHMFNFEEDRAVWQTKAGLMDGFGQDKYNLNRSSFIWSLCGQVLSSFSTTPLLCLLIQ